MPIKQSDGERKIEDCCDHPPIINGECDNCGHNWQKHDGWVPF